MQRIPLLRVRRQCSQRTFSSAGLASGWDKSEPSAACDVSFTVGSSLMERSWLPVAVVR